MRPASVLGPRITAALMVMAVLVTATLALMAAGCGRGEEPTTTAGPATTQAQSTTSLAATTTTPPTTAPPQTSTTTTAASTIPPASGPTTTEALSSAETRLPDGTIKAMGYIDKAWEQNGTRYISIDYAEMLTGDAALKAAIEDGVLQPGDTLDNDYYIRNQNTKLREFTVAPDVVITTATRMGGMDQPATWQVFLSFWSANPPEDATHLKDVPWWIVRDGGEVISLSEQYLP